MSITVVFMAVVAAFVVWWLLPQKLTAKPWLEHGPTEDVHSAGIGSLPAAKVGLVIFLAVVTSLFALFISAYSMRMKLGDWSPLPDPGLLWLNTGVLFLSSVAFQSARNATRRGQADRVKAGLIAGGVLTLLFLAGQLWAWRQLNASGYFVTSNPANAFFYLLTALHGLHLLGGLWVWGKATFKAWPSSELGEVRLSVELCTVYWHYLLLIWLGLFGLLLST